MSNVLDRYLNAITARKNGVFDDPDLMSFGALGSEAEDITYIAKTLLNECGFFVGARNPTLNMKYPGRFMVLECPEDVTGPTEDGARGPWCIVGDDLPSLIATAFAYAADAYDDRNS